MVFHRRVRLAVKRGNRLVDRLLQHLAELHGGIKIVPRGVELRLAGHIRSGERGLTVEFACVEIDIGFGEVELRHRHLIFRLHGFHIARRRL